MSQAIDNVVSVDVEYPSLEGDKEISFIIRTIHFKSGSKVVVLIKSSAQVFQKADIVALLEKVEWINKQVEPSPQQQPAEQPA